MGGVRMAAPLPNEPSWNTARRALCHACPRLTRFSKRAAPGP
jgi:hypothetical protein